jgi:hypothetical protein
MWLSISLKAQFPGNGPPPVVQELKKGDFTAIGSASGEYVNATLCRKLRRTVARSNERLEAGHSIMLAKVTKRK